MRGKGESGVLLDRRLRYHVAAILKRICYLHVGTHKTGTTSIQAFLAMNETAFAKAGVLVPRTGRMIHAWLKYLWFFWRIVPWLPLSWRVRRPWGNHHNIAWELIGDPHFSHRRGTFAELLHELRKSQHPRAVLSSEDFGFLCAAPAILRAMNAAFAAIGYRVIPIVYLRDQADYAASLYDQLLKKGKVQVSFEKFASTILCERAWPREGRWYNCFAYGELVDAFAAAFGSIVVRPYPNKRENEALLRDFTAIIAPDLERSGFDSLILPPQLNRSRLEIPLPAGYREAFAKTFTDDNARIEASYGVVISAEDGWPARSTAEA